MYLSTFTFPGRNLVHGYVVHLRRVGSTGATASVFDCWGAPMTHDRTTSLLLRVTYQPKLVYILDWSSGSSGAKYAKYRSEGLALKTAI